MLANPATLAQGQGLWAKTPHEAGEVKDDP